MNIIKNKYIKNIPYMQVLFVVLSFAIMVYSGYMIGSNIIRTHIRLENEERMDHIEAQISYNLKELETLLGVASVTIKGMLLQGRSYDEVKGYITDITNFGRNESNVIGFISFFAMFDIFGGAGYNGLGWEGEPGYIPEDRLWYKAAVASNGEIVSTDPYIDYLTREVSITYVQCIYDDDGNRLAIVCMDVALDKVSEFTSYYDNNENIYIYLLDSNFNFISAREDYLLGMRLRDVGSDFAGIEDEMKQGIPVIEREFYGRSGDKNVLSGRQIENGWHIAVGTLIDNYYSSLRQMRRYIIILGLVLAAVLNLILIRIHFAKGKAEEQARKKTKSVAELKNAIMETMADLVERRDSNTGGHISRTSKVLQIIIEAMLQNKIYSEQTVLWNIDQMIQSAQLHDVGKIAINDSILNKPGKLTAEEFEIMKKHTVFGGEVIKNIQTKTNEEKEFLDYAYIFSLYHHEKWDGSGYPHGLSVENIPLPARVMAIIDVYDALISERPYKKAFSHKEAVDIIKDGSASHFDPLLTELFVAVSDKLVYDINQEIKE